MRFLLVPKDKDKAPMYTRAFNDSELTDFWAIAIDFQTNRYMSNTHDGWKPMPLTMNPFFRTHEFAWKRTSNELLKEKKGQRFTMTIAHLPVRQTANIKVELHDNLLNTAFTHLTSMTEYYAIGQNFMPYLKAVFRDKFADYILTEMDKEL